MSRLDVAELDRSRSFLPSWVYFLIIDLPCRLRDLLLPLQVLWVFWLYGRKPALRYSFFCLRSVFIVTLERTCLKTQPHCVCLCRIFGVVWQKAGFEISFSFFCLCSVSIVTLERPSRRPISPFVCLCGVIGAVWKRYLSPFLVCVKCVYCYLGKAKSEISSSLS